MKLEPPTKPPKTRKEYAQEIVRYGRDINFFNLTTEFPCWRCSGEGYKKVSVSYYDLERVDCYNCDGTGKVSKEKFNSVFNVKWTNYREELEKFKNNKKILTAAKKKLTKEELSLIRYYE